MKLQYFDLLSPLPINIEGVGTLIIPTLLNIRQIGYEKYENFIKYLSVSFEAYLELVNLKEKYNTLTDEYKKYNTFYNIMINHTEFKDIYQDIFSFFISENIYFDENIVSYLVWVDIPTDKKTYGNINITFDKDDHIYLVCKKEVDTNSNVVVGHVIGCINNNNFDNIRNCLLQINYLNNSEVTLSKIKNKKAREIYEKIQKAKSEIVKPNKQKDTLDLPNMISKFCVNNKTGINILNVWQLSIFQFYDQFIQNNYCKQSEIQDMVYTNTVSFSDLSAYDPELWLKNNKQ